MTAATPRRVGRPPGPRRDPIERREALLDAAVTAIRTHGADVSMADVAAAADVTRPILYDHFGDRAGIAAALADRYIGDLVGALMKAFGQPTTLRDVIGHGVDIFCKFVEKEPDVYRFLQTATAPSGSIESSIGTGLTSVLDSALKAVDGDTALAPTWAYAILGMVFAAAEWWSITKAVSRPVLVRQLTSLIADGLSGAGVIEVTGPFPLGT